LPPELAAAAIPAPPSKLAERLSAQIEAAIRANGWPAGHSLGAEEELAAQYGASRAALREAIAIAEWNGLVERRRGRDGGVFIAGFTLAGAVANLRNFLLLAGAGLPDLLLARRLVEGRILHLALERLDPGGRVALGRIALGRLAGGASPDGDPRTRLDRLKTIVERQAAIAGSPALQLFGSALRHAFVDRVRTTGIDDSAYLAASTAVADLRLAQVHAMLEDDRQAARDLQTRALDLWESFIAAHPPGTLGGAAIVDRLCDPRHDALIYQFVQPARRPEALARAIAQGIANRALAPGMKLGTEQLLIAEYAVSRRVLREGLRILESTGVVHTERGMRGGLVVAAARRDTLLTLLPRALGGAPDAAALTLLPDLLRASAAALADAPLAARTAFADQMSGGRADCAAQAASATARATPDVPAGCLALMLLPHTAAGAAGSARDLVIAIRDGNRPAAATLARRLAAPHASPPASQP